MRRIGWVLLILMLLSALVAPHYLAQEKQVVRGEAVVLKVTGSVKMLRAPWWNFWAWKDVKVGQELWDGDRVQVGRKSTVEIQFYNKTQLRILENSTVVMGKSTLYNYGADSDERASSILVKTGEVWVQVEKALSKIFKFKVETPNAVAGVRGTLFSVQVSGKTSEVVVDNGTVEVQQRKTAEMVLVTGGGATQVIGRSRPQDVFTADAEKRSRLKDWGDLAKEMKYDLEALKEKKENEEKDRKDKEEKEKDKKNRENGQNKDRDDNGQGENGKENGNGKEHDDEEEDHAGGKRISTGS